MAEKKSSKKASSKKAPTIKPRRAVIVGGVRTPFVKAFGEFLKLDTIALADVATKALLDRTEVPHHELDGIVWGGVILPGLSPNIAREVALDLRLPASVEGFTCTRACASGLQAVTLAAQAIERGDADVLIAGGSDSTSNAEVKLPQKAVHALAPLAFGKASSAADYIAVLSQLVPITNLGSRLWFWPFLAGLMISTQGGDLGRTLVWVGIALFSATVLFQIVTLPTEFNASNRAKAVLAQTGIVATQDEAEGVRKVLGAAAMTYVAAAIAQVVQLVYLLLRARE